MEEYPHQPVMVQEVINILLTTEQGVYVDGTAGSGGHSQAIAERIDRRGRLICLDRDPVAVRLARKRLEPFGKKVTVIHSNYVETDQVLKESGYGKASGILLDLGLSSYQLDQSGRGFSFQKDEPLDMRMNPEQELTAEHIISRLSTRDLEKMIREFGEEKKARPIAQSIVRERRKRQIQSSLQLANIIETAAGSGSRAKGKHPATLTFQALRLAVNQELENLKLFLEKAPGLLNQGGRLVILSYHSLEDRMVKRAMIDWEKNCSCPPGLPVCVCGKKPLFKRPFKKPVQAGRIELSQNPRARSARLRAAERV